MRDESNEREEEQGMNNTERETDRFNYIKKERDYNWLICTLEEYVDVL